MSAPIQDQHAPTHDLGTTRAAAESSSRRLHSALRNLQAVVMLAGSVRANQLRKATGRSPLEMPVSVNRTVLHEWCDQLDLVAQRAGLQDLPVRIMVDQSAQLDTAGRDTHHLSLRVERDPSAYRGTGGLLSDLAREYGDDARLLVLHGSQLPFAPIAESLEEHANAAADVTIVAEPDGTPSGIMLLRCGCLRAINPVGFVDLNEQAMPEIAKRFDVRVARTPRPTTRSLRTLSSYLETLRIYHHQRTGRLIDDSPFAEDWQASFAVIEGGTIIDDQAIVHDSVVLSGARVEPGAVVVRSVVCPGAVVGRGERRVDRVVMGRVY